VIVGGLVASKELHRILRIDEGIRTEATKQGHTSMRDWLGLKIYLNHKSS
jgi:hypothetical protein